MFNAFLREIFTGIAILNMSVMIKGFIFLDSNVLNYGEFKLT